LAPTLPAPTTVILFRNRLIPFQQLNRLLKNTGTDQTGTFFARPGHVFRAIVRGEKGCPVLSVPFFQQPVKLLERNKPIAK
ncbi:MAG TPA: hypothetical protein VEF06_06765, partial [Bryobacteraceae bacterium]|nr:hypothetical protein [Bryobacteraceae bacterium]